MQSFQLLISCYFILLLSFFHFTKKIWSKELQFNEFDDYLFDDGDDFEIGLTGNTLLQSTLKEDERGGVASQEKKGIEFNYDDEEEEDEEDEEEFSKPLVPQPKLTVLFENLYLNETIELFWISEQGEDVFMGEIPSYETVRVDTTASHSFLGKIKRSGALANPSLFVVAKEKSKYAFTPKQETGKGKAAPRPFISVLNQVSTSCSAKFRSLVPSPIDVWYDDGKSGTYQGSLDLGKEYTVNSYIGHVFYFTAKGNKKKEYARHTVRADQVVYVIEDPDHPAPQHMLDHLHKEVQFMEEYQNRTGLQWRHYYGPNGPRGPPTLHMWPADEIGQVHKVTSTEGYWTCPTYTSPERCQSTDLINLELEVISLRPKAFLIKNFLSEIEVDAIIAYSSPRMDSSFVGNKDAGGARKSDTRTSRNTWVGRGAFPVTESLYRRAEQLLNISRLDAKNAEDMQVVHYIHGQRYDSHHDWGVSGYPESRFITLLLYLTDMVSIDAGGETAFPKAANGKGLKVHAGKGNALLFYNLLEDGNGDDLSLHAALPVTKGEKWLANFWVWDPHRK